MPPTAKWKRKKKKENCNSLHFSDTTNGGGTKEKKKKIFRYLVHVSQVPDESNKKRGKTKLQQQQQPRK
jgi:hypothetical protein